MTCGCHGVQLLKEDDNNWPMPDRVGRQELEIVMGSEHISFTTTKLGSLLQVGPSIAVVAIRAGHVFVGDQSVL